ncbi:MAG: protein-disulfide reductase DsbD [Sulfurovum sp.]|nr:protein-disulfide reductase DsbD [Sulfurovum sp.]
MIFILFSGVLFAADVPEASQSTLALVAATFGAGLLLTFTPCVLPMVPIVSSIVAGQGEGLTKMRAFWLSLSYVLGTAVTYAIMGALAGATGEQLQSYFQNIWAIGFVSVIFVAMALSMFGLYTIQLPASLQSKLDSYSRTLKGGSLLPVFLLGMISALILGACVSPILISFLSIAIGTQDPVLGALTMFSLALGMGVPLMVVGVGAGSLIPKAGAWMEEVKHFFGVLLLAVAVYLFNELNLLSELLVWGLFAVVLGVYWHALEPLPQESGRWALFRKAAGVVLLIWGTILLVGAAKGGEDLYHPLESDRMVQGTVTAQVRPFPFELVRNMEELEKKRQEAVRSDKLLVIYFYSDTCGVCKRMKATTFKDRRVQEKLAKDFVAVRVNITSHDNKESMEIKKHFKVFGTPSFVFFDRTGEEMPEENFYGYQSPEEFYDTLDLMS